MINKVYNNNGLGILGTYNKFNEPKKEEKQKAFMQTLNSDKDKSKMTSIDTVLGSSNKDSSTKNVKLSADALFRLSDTAKTLKEIAKEFNIRHMNLEEMKSIGEKLYDQELISGYDFKEILDKSEEMVNNSNNAQDLLGLWENKLELLKENNSPRGLIERAQHVIQLLRNIEAMHSTSTTVV